MIKNIPSANIGERQQGVEPSAQGGGGVAQQRGQRGRERGGGVARAHAQPARARHALPALAGTPLYRGKIFYFWPRDADAYQRRYKSTHAAFLHSPHTHCATV